MHAGSPTGSAQIIPFPGRNRAPQSAFEAGLATSEGRSKPIYDAAFASSWYHEDAVVDAQQLPKS